MIARNKPNSTGQPDAPPRFDPDAERQPISPMTRRFLWYFSIAMVITAGTAFLFKLIEFLYSFTNSENFVGPGAASYRFAVAPLMTYLIVAAGFACLFIWAYLSGHFRNVEEPKYRMLEMQDEIDIAENVAAAKGEK